MTCFHSFDDCVPPKKGCNIYLSPAYSDGDRGASVSLKKPKTSINDNFFFPLIVHPTHKNTNKDFTGKNLNHI